MKSIQIKKKWKKAAACVLAAAVLVPCAMIPSNAMQQEDESEEVQTEEVQNEQTGMQEEEPEEQETSREDQPKEQEISEEDTPEENIPEEEQEEQQISSEDVQESGYLNSWSLDEYSRMYDRALEVSSYSDRKAQSGALAEEIEESLLSSNSSVISSEGEPTVSLSKTAEWTDIEQGYANLTITEEDIPGVSNQGMDYLIILDRTRTMSLNDRGFEGDPSDYVSSSHSPCLNADHYYLYEGDKIHLYDYSHGIIEGTDTVVEIPSGAHLYEHHYNENDEWIDPDYDNGCQDRLSIAEDTICELIDKIEAHSPTENTSCRSRVSYWSFAGCYWPEMEGDVDTDHERGLYNYIALTDEYSKVKEKVKETGSYAGTYYQESMQRAYKQLSEREGVYEDLPSKIIFISDGKCSDDYEEVMYWNNLIKDIPDCTIYTLAIGMPAESDAAVFLKGLSSAGDASTFAAFTTNLNSENSALSDTMTTIEKAKVQVNARSREVKDLINTKYWESAEIVSIDGEASLEDGILDWQIPDYYEDKAKVVIKLKLKDEYRFKISDTEYPTNLDTEEEEGCNLSYVIFGGPYHLKMRTISAETPYLPYGAVRVSGNKYWTVEGSEAENIKITLSRKISCGEAKQDANASDAGSTEENDTAAESEEVNHGIITASDNWFYVFDRKDEEDKEGKLLPLVLYDNTGERYHYEITEYADSYHLISVSQTEEDGQITADLYNEPFKIKVRVKKLDAGTNAPLSGALFGIYEYFDGSLEPYKGNDSCVCGTEELYLTDLGNGEYESSWIYYSPENQGKFRVVEEQAPEGYDEGDPSAGFDFAITEDNDGRIVSQSMDGSSFIFYNVRTVVPEPTVFEDPKPALPDDPGTSEDPSPKSTEEDPKTPESTSFDTPSTGDDNHAAAYLILLGLSGAVILSAVIRKRRDR